MAHETETPNPCIATGAHRFELVLERVFDASPEKIWKAWTTPQLLMQWFCPLPWRVTEAIIEPEVGGAFTFTMQGPEGEVVPNDGVFLLVEPNRRWITTDAFVKGWLPAGVPFMSAEVTLTPLADGRTRYVATARHWNEATMNQHAAMGFQEGWGAAADQLADLLKTL